MRIETATLILFLHKIDMHPLIYSIMRIRNTAHPCASIFEHEQDIGAALIGTKRENQLTEMDLKEMKESEAALAEEMSAARARQKENTTQVHNTLLMCNAALV